MSKLALMRKLNDIAKMNHRRKGSAAYTEKFKDIFVVVLLAMILVFIIAALATSFISTTNSLTTGATPVIGGGGAAILNQTSLFIGIVIALVIIGIVFVVLDATVLSKRGRR